MKPLPLPLRVAAGLAATAIERARELPEQLVGLPVTVASQAMQLSMRVQQEITALAIKGDEALASFRPVDETPEWATFDEDVERGTTMSRPKRDRNQRGRDQRNARAGRRGRWSEAAIAEAEQAARRRAGLPNYDDLSLPQLRARLRTFSLPELEELLRYEESNAARPSFIGMLTRRIASRAQARRPRLVSSDRAPTHPEQPWPVRTVARKIADWINRLGTVWVEGQVTQLSTAAGHADRVPHAARSRRGRLDVGDVPDPAAARLRAAAD